MLCAFLVLLSAVSIATGDECEPGFADTCFTSVTSDLKYMLDLKKMAITNISRNAVHELCLSLEDSLNCTSDIIDEDCVQGRAEFDSWLKALRGAFHYICQVDERRMRDLLQGISCWSVEEFILCTEDLAGLGHVRNLLHRKLNDKECENLHHVASKCLKTATIGSCREQDQVFTYARNMLHAFFTRSDCDNVKHRLLSSSSNRMQLSTLLATTLSISLLLVL